MTTIEFNKKTYNNKITDIIPSFHLANVSLNEAVIAFRNGRDAINGILQHLVDLTGKGDVIKKDYFDDALKCKKPSRPWLEGLEAFVNQLETSSRAVSSDEALIHIIAHFQSIDSPLQYTVYNDAQTIKQAANWAQQIIYSLKNLMDPKTCSNPQAVNSEISTINVYIQRIRQKVNAPFSDFKLPSDDKNNFPNLMFPRGPEVRPIPIGI
jgi:hypothetical protein